MSNVLSLQSCFGKMEQVNKFHVSYKPIWLLVLIRNKIFIFQKATEGFQRNGLKVEMLEGLILHTRK